jgi:hypothetical protein
VYQVYQVYELETGFLRSGLGLLRLRLILIRLRLLYIYVFKMNLKLSWWYVPLVHGTPPRPWHCNQDLDTEYVVGF